MRAKVGALTASFKKRKPDAEHFRLTADIFDSNILEEYASGQGLFEKKYVVVLDGLTGDVKARESLLDYLQQLQESDNIFIVVEGGLDKATVKKIGKYAEKTEEHSSHIVDRKFNMFLLTDALAVRDKKKLWGLFHQALFEGKSVEEVYGILFWQIKTLLLACNAQSAQEAGLKPFVFSKAKSACKRFSIDELKNLSYLFVSEYHNSRRKAPDLSIRLEKLILKM